MEYKVKKQNNIYKFMFWEGAVSFKLLWRVVGFVIATIMLGGFLCSPIGAADSDKKNNNIRLFLYEHAGEEGIVELDISISSSMGVCAMLCELEYDPDSLIYLSGGACDENINFKAVDFGGEVRLLIDCITNSAPDGNPARLYFKRIGTGSSNFSLTCPDALYIDENGEISRANVQIFADTPLEKEEIQAHPNDEIAPTIVNAEIREDSVFFSVGVSDECFAAGVRLFFVDLSGNGDHFEVLVAGAVRVGEMLRGEYRFCPDKSYAVVITAQGYSGKRTVKGDKIILVYTQ